MTNSKKENKSRAILFGSLLFLSGISLLFFDWYKDYRKEVIDNEMVETFFEEEKKPIDELKKEEQEKKSVSKKAENYIGILEIPKIKLKRGLVDINSKRNNVKYNIQIIKSSTMPNVKNGNFILASHSGGGYNAFFTNLYKLNMGDETYVYFNNVKYTYKITDIYEVEKTGRVEINRDYNKTILTMITCSQTNKKVQIVFISELINEEIY